MFQTVDFGQSEVSDGFFLISQSYKGFLDFHTWVIRNTSKPYVPDFTVPRRGGLCIKKSAVIYKWFWLKCIKYPLLRSENVSCDHTWIVRVQISSCGVQRQKYFNNPKHYSARCVIETVRSVPEATEALLKAKGYHTNIYTQRQEKVCVPFGISWFSE